MFSFQANFEFSCKLYLKSIFFSEGKYSEIFLNLSHSLFKHEFYCVGYRGLILTVCGNFGSFFYFELNTEGIWWKTINLPNESWNIQLLNDLFFVVNSWWEINLDISQWRLSYQSTYTGWSVKHDRVFLVFCIEWLTCTLYTRALDKSLFPRYQKKTQPCLTGHPVWSTTPCSEFRSSLKHPSSENHFLYFFSFSLQML